MTRLTFSDYTTRLREFIRRHAHDVRAADKLSVRETLFNELALKLFELQFAFNLPYRRFCQGRGASPEDVSHWMQIPAIPASVFKELELTSLAPGERTAVFQSSGTTDQKPGCHFHSPESLAVYEASLLPWFQAHLLADFEPHALESCGQDVGAPVKMIFLTPSPALAPRSSLVHMFEVVRRELGAPDSIFNGRVEADGAWALHMEKTRCELARAAEAKRPLALLGTAFNFVHLLDYLAERSARFPLPARSRVLETGGYKGRSRSLPKSQLHALITEFLGISPGQIVCEYGMSELSSQAYDAKVQSPDAEVQSSRSAGQSPVRSFRFPPWARAQVISPETGREVGEGEAGLIRVWDLANVQSVMAIQTEDLAIRRGAGFELLGRASLAEPRGCSLMAAEGIAG